MMIIANRLVFFVAILLLYYTCEKYPSTIQKKGPLVIKRVAYSGFLISLSYVIGGVIFEFLIENGFTYGNEVVTTPVTAAITSVIILFISFFAPKNKVFLTTEIKKTMMVVLLLLSLSTFTLIEPEYLIKEVLIYGGMYFLFAIAFTGVKDRVSIAPIPNFLKGYPVDLLTLFLFLLSFSFLNGVFFDQLF